MLKLSRRIAAEVESGAVDEVEMSDEQLKQIAEVLAGRARAARLVTPTMMGIALAVHELATVSIPVRHVMAAVSS